MKCYTVFSMALKKLMTDRRFWPVFWTQFWGAFNDNFFKSALIILATYSGLSVAGFEADRMAPLITGLMIVPFLIFSGIAGEMADKWDKAKMMFVVKAAEVVIIALACVGLYLQNAPVLLVAAFLAGTHAAFFTPAKYSILPQILQPHELVAGNAWVETGTCLAVLLGSLVGGMMITHVQGSFWVGFSMMTVAALGLFTASRIVPAPPETPELRVTRNPVLSVTNMMKVALEDRGVFRAILGICWFWAFGTVMTSVVPYYTKTVLNGDAIVVVAIFGVMSIGVVVGSLFSEKLSRGGLDLGLIPFGAMGLSAFSYLLFWLGGSPKAADSTHLLSLGEFTFRQDGMAIFGLFFFLSIFSGIFVVPLYAFTQKKADPAKRSRIIAANSFLNSVFMVGASGGVILLRAFDVSMPGIFLFLALANVAVAAYVYLLIPEFFLRFMAWIVGKVFYRVRVRGLEKIPRQGPVVVVSNHQSYIDWLIIGGIIPRPARFVMHKKFYENPLVKWLCEDVKAIPIASGAEDKRLLVEAFDRISQELRRGQLVFIFPEGDIPRDGKMMQFRKGIERILERDPVPVIPLRLEGLWGSFFSRYSGKAFRHFPKRRLRHFRSHLRLTFGDPLDPKTVTADGLRELIESMARE